MPRLLTTFFESDFLESQDLAPVEIKRYRNAIGRASQLLEHPIEYGDTIEKGFRTWFIENLLRIGFTVSRAEEFFVCIKKVSRAMREARRVKPRPAPSFIEQAFEWIADHPRSIREMFSDIIYDDDQLLSGAAQQLETIQRQIDESEVA